MTEAQPAAKAALRKKLASLSFSEKIKILEKLCDRSLAFAANGPRHVNKTTEAAQSADKKFCTCADWEPCGCGHQPPYHCAWCCLELSPEQFELARSRGWYPNAHLNPDPSNPATKDSKQME